MRHANPESRGRQLVRRGTHPKVVWEDFTYPKVACLGAMVVMVLRLVMVDKKIRRKFVFVAIFATIWRVEARLGDCLCNGLFGVEEGSESE